MGGSKRWAKSTWLTASAASKKTPHPRRPEAEQGSPSERIGKSHAVFRFSTSKGLSNDDESKGPARDPRQLHRRDEQLSQPMRESDPDGPALPRELPRPERAYRDER